MASLLFSAAHKAKSQRQGFGLTNPAGVGIVFKSGPDESLFVKALADSGPAAGSGLRSRTLRRKQGSLTSPARAFSL